MTVFMENTEERTNAPVTEPFGPEEPVSDMPGPDTGEPVSDMPGADTTLPSKADTAADILRAVFILVMGLIYCRYVRTSFGSVPVLFVIFTCSAAAFVLARQFLCLRCGPLDGRRLKTFDRCCVLVLGIVYILHLVFYKTSDGFFPELLASLSAILFTLILYSIAPKLVRCFSGRTSYDYGIRASDTNRFWQIVLIALGIRIVTTFLGIFIYSLARDCSSNLFEAWQEAWMKGNTDCYHYLNIAENLYTASGDDKLFIVFFPLFPLLIRILNYAIHNSFISAQLLNTVFSCFAAGLFYKTLRLDLPERRAFLGAMVFMLMPGAVFMNSAMSEPLFALLLCCFFLFLRKKEYLFAGVFAALAGFTRSVGVLLAIPLAVCIAGDLVGRAKKHELKASFIIGALCSLIISVFGTLGYLLINKVVTGNALMFLEYQKSHWHQSIGYFFNTPRYMWNYSCVWLEDGDLRTAVTLGFVTILAIFLSLEIYLRKAKELPISYSVFFVFYFVIAIGCTWLLSAVRYLSVLLPLIAAIALIPKKRSGEIALVGVMGVIYLGYLVLYMLRMDVY